MLCANYGSGQSLDCPAQSMDPQIAQAIYRLTRPQACHTTTSSFVAWVSESANGRTDASFLVIEEKVLYPYTSDACLRITPLGLSNQVRLNQAHCQERGRTVAIMHTRREDTIASLASCYMRLKKWTVNI